jgi:hypothetical protein
MLLSFVSVTPTYPNFAAFKRDLLAIFTIKGKAIPVTDREGSYGCETSMLPHFLDNRFTDGGEVK